MQLAPLQDNLSEGAKFGSGKQPLTTCGAHCREPQTWSCGVKAMKISDPVRPGTISRPGAARAAAPTSAVAKTTASTSVAGPASVIDVQGLLGIPAQELTPRVREAFVALLREVEVLRDDLERAKSRLAEMEQLADTDTLSPIANRRAFVRELTRIMSYAARYKVSTSLLFFDLNGLKQINDTFGHAAGDAVLMHTADIFQENIRGSDIVGRLGGDEFAIILSHASEEQARLKAEQLLAALADSVIMHDGQPLKITSAVGVYTFGPEETPAMVLERADKAMYAHKRSLQGV
jgi:diguanylate cyclase (GGDEF)-like protein